MLYMYILAVAVAVAEAYTTGLRPPGTVRVRRSSVLPVPDSLPPRYDFRSTLAGPAPVVRNQRGCGGCWAFATAGVLEYLQANDSRTIEPVALSVEQLIACNRQGFSCATGGWWAFDDVRPPNGLVTERCLPYTATDRPCPPVLDACTPRVSVGEWDYVAGEDDPGTERLKAALLHFGPLVTAVSVGNAFYVYAGGVFTVDYRASVLDGRKRPSPVSVA